MKIYFCGSVVGKEFYIDNYELIVRCLNELGHEVIYKHLFDVDKSVVEKQTIEEHIKVHKKLAKWMIESDLVVAELSYRSFAQGQEISHAFRIGKPVLGIYSGKDRPHLVLDDALDKLLLSRYSVANIKEVLKDGIEYLSPISNKRFTMILPSHLVDYLDKISSGGSVSRSEYIRLLLEKDMEGKR